MLIIFFISIILYKVIKFFSNTVEGMSTKVEGMSTKIEGMENTTTTTTDYKEYDKNDPNNCLILAQQNSGNIDYLKSRMDELIDVKNDVNNMKQSVQTMQVQMDELVQQQGDMAVEMAGGEEPVELDGMDEDIVDDGQSSSWGYELDSSLEELLAQRVDFHAKVSAALAPEEDQQDEQQAEKEEEANVLFLLAPSL